MQTVLFIVGFLLFIGLVIVHEWGHYKAAVRNGVKVEEFGIGFPPKAWGRRLKSGMIFSLNWLPIGGFVRMKGENDSDNRPGSFGAASLAAKTKILLAGVGMNFLVGIVLLTLLAFIGLPQIINSQTVGEEQFSIPSDARIVSQQVRAGYIQPGSPADKAGVESYDIISRISNGTDSRSIKTSEDLREATSDFAGQTVTLDLERKKKDFTTEATLLSREEVEDSRITENPKGHLGVTPAPLQINRYTWSAPIVALGFTWQFIELTMKGLASAFAGLGSTIAGLVTGNETARQAGQAQASSQVGGPIAIVAVLWSSGSFGLNFLLMIIAILSLTLAVINLLPVPALDGGRLALTLFSRGVLKRPLSKTAEERIVGGSMLALLALIVLITIVDVKRFF